MHSTDTQTDRHLRPPLLRFLLHARVLLHSPSGSLTERIRCGGGCAEVGKTVANERVQAIGMEARLVDVTLAPCK